MIQYLKEKYEAHIGSTIKIVGDSVAVDKSASEPTIQVSFLKPVFSDDEKIDRSTHVQQNTDISSSRFLDCLFSFG